MESSVDDIHSFIEPLNGEWEFYWKRFLSYEDFYDTDTIKPQIVNVPSYWTDYNIDGEFLDRHGYATYRKKIKFQKSYPDTLGLRIPVFDDSYRLYIDSFLISESGYPCDNKGNSEPGYNPVTKLFELKKKTPLILLFMWLIITIAEAGSGKTCF